MTNVEIGIGFDILEETKRNLHFPDPKIMQVIEIFFIDNLT